MNENISDPLSFDGQLTITVSQLFLFRAETNPPKGLKDWTTQPQSQNMSAVEGTVSKRNHLNQGGILRAL